MRCFFAVCSPLFAVPFVACISLSNLLPFCYSHHPLHYIVTTLLTTAFFFVLPYSFSFFFGPYHSTELPGLLFFSRTSVVPLYQYLLVQIAFIAPYRICHSSNSPLPVTSSRFLHIRSALHATPAFLLPLLWLMRFAYTHHDGCSQLECCTIT